MSKRWFLLTVACVPGLLSCKAAGAMAGDATGTSKAEGSGGAEMSAQCKGDFGVIASARKLEARLAPPVAGPPRALYRVLRRGLSPQPRARYAELADLLAGIDRASAARRRAARLALAPASSRPGGCRSDRNPAR